MPKRAPTIEEIQERVLEDSDVSDALAIWIKAQLRGYNTSNADRDFLDVLRNDVENAACDYIEIEEECS